MLQVDSKLEPATKHLHQYQVLVFNSFSRLTRNSITALMKNIIQEGTASGYDIICRDGEFSVHETCVYFSDFLFDQHETRKKYKSENNKEIQLKQFRKSSIKIVFDALYGIPKDETR